MNSPESLDRQACLLGDAGPTQWLKEALGLSVADETNKSESVAVESNELATEVKRVAHYVKHAIEAGKPWPAHTTSGEFEEGSSVEEMLRSWRTSWMQNVVVRVP